MTRTYNTQTLFYLWVTSSYTYKYTSILYVIISEKIASEMPVPHSLGKYFEHHEI